MRVKSPNGQIDPRLRVSLAGSEQLAWRDRIPRSFERRWPYILIAPSIIYVGAVIVYPLMSGLLLSLQDARLLRPERAGFIWLANYVALFQDHYLWVSLRNTVVWVSGGVTIQLGIGMALALLLNGRYRGVAITRVLVLLPWFLPSVVVAHMWTLMLDPRFGVVNDLLGRLGLLNGDKAWFADPNTALFAAMGIEAWWAAPFFALFLLAGLQSIPDELVDAAKVDGASGVQRFRYLSLPLLRPVIVIATVLQIIRLTNSPDLLQILTGGGPGNASLVLSLYAFRTAYLRFDFGYAAAISVLVLFVLSAFAIVYFKASGVTRD